MANAFVAGDWAAARIAMHGMYFESAGLILALITLGKFFEARAKGRTTGAIEALMNLTPKTAVVERDGKEETVSAADVHVGDILVSPRGKRHSVDGVVVEGEFGDESAITGEAIPVEKAVGAHVTGATVSVGGWFKMQAQAVGDDTTLPVSSVLLMRQRAQRFYRAPCRYHCRRLCQWSWYWRFSPLSAGCLCLHA